MLLCVYLKNKRKYFSISRFLSAHDSIQVDCKGEYNVCTYIVCLEWQNLSKENKEMETGFQTNSQDLAFYLWGEGEVSAAKLAFQ